MPTKKLLPLLIFSLAYSQDLENVLNTAIKNNYKIKSYEHTIKSKEYAIKKAKDQLYPSVSVYASFTREKYEEEYPYATYKTNDKITTYGISLKQNIYNPKIFAQIKDAKLKKKIAFLDKEAFTLNLYQNVLNTYFEIITNKQCLIFYKKRKENYKKILQDIEERVKYKYATITDLTQAKSNYYISVNDYIRAKAQYENSIKKLQLLLLTQKTINIPYITKDNIDELIKKMMLPYEKYKKMLNNNPTVKQAKIYVEISKNQIKANKYNLYPNITLNAGYSNSNSTDSVPKKHDYKASINFNLNLYNGGAIRDSISEAKQLYLSAINDYEYQKNSLELDLNKNWGNLLNYLEIVKSDKQKIIQTKDYLQKAKESYKYKLITLSDYYKAENDYFQALINFEKDKFNLLYYYTAILSETGLIKKEIKKFNYFLK